MATPANERRWVQRGRDRRQAPRGPERRANWPPGGMERVHCCPRCHIALGSTDGQKLTVGGVIIAESITLTCVACRQSYEWHPELSEV